LFEEAFNVHGRDPLAVSIVAAGVPFKMDQGPRSGRRGPPSIQTRVR
jgi:hypothetical protein